MKKLAFICTLAVSFLTLTSARTSLDKRVAAFEKDFNSLGEELSCIGAGASVVIDGKIVFTGTRGVNDLALRQEVTSGQYFRVGDIARTIPAIAVLQLVDKGQADLGADISDYLGFELRNPASPQKPLTLRMLLSSTAGLDPDAQLTNISMLDARKNPGYAEYFLPGVKAGAKYKSATAGYVIAAAIVEKITGKRFDDYASENIFKPMGISATYDAESLDDASLLSSYVWSATGKKYIKQKRIYSAFDTKGYILGESTAMLKPAGGLVMTLEDLTVMLQTYMNSMKTPDGKLILSKASAAEFLKPQLKRKKTCLGLTADASAVPDYILMTATGVTSGTSAAIFFNLDEKIGMAAFCTGSHDENVGGEHFCKDIRNIFTKHFVD